MSFEQQNNEERRISFQQPVRRFFKTLNSLDPEIYYDLHAETQKLFQHELGLSYEEWIAHDGAAGFKLLNKLGLPTQAEYEADFDGSVCRVADMTVSLLGPLVESRVRSFDESWEDFNKTDDEARGGGIDARDLEVWYLNAARGAMAVYEEHSSHNSGCLVYSSGAGKCQDISTCPVARLHDQLTTRSIYDGDSQSFLETDQEVGLMIYQQKMHTAYDLGLVTKDELDRSQRWTK